MPATILVTDSNDVPLRSIDRAHRGANPDTFLFRVWNNRLNKVSISKALKISLQVKSEPLPQNKVITGNNVIKARCTYSAKLDAPIAEIFKNLPLSNTSYDEIPSNMFNEYEIQLDATVLSGFQKEFIKDFASDLYVVVDFVSETV